ncbi:MAG: addiction module antidote protein, HigA family [Comamonadaceae bacterium CG2_30_59_20]|nr:MAG: addiction module antidote protein, HigA family [Comamonadaceae bacterium CG2_30_59_20]
MRLPDIPINRTDWTRVKADAAQDAPIHWEEQCDPNDPNDAESVSAYWQASEIIHSPGVPDLMDKKHKPSTSSPPAKGLTRNQGGDMTMNNHAHPGELITGWRNDLQLDLATFAEHHGISLQRLSRVTQCLESIFVDLDRCLAEALGTTPGYWLSLQNQWDFWTAQTSAETTAIKTSVVSSGESS